MSGFSRLFLLLTAVLLAACGAGPKPDAATAECRQLYAGLDHKTDAAGVRDAAAYPIPGFPYLRVNRFLASFRNEVTGEPRFTAWLRQLQELDLEARGIELRNLGEPEAQGMLERLRRCSRQLAGQELAAPEWRERLRGIAAVPADYSWLQRALGFYPIAAPFMKLVIRSYHREIRQDYARPVETLDAPGRLYLWRPAAAAGAAQGLNAARDPLGIPQLSDEQWQQLAAAYAPAWWIETTGSYDLPGTPVLKGGQPGHDPQRPAVYFLHSYTRFSGQVLPQLVYIIWFSERPPMKAVDAYAGTLDGVVWRVTLDSQGQPLLYDTIHPCGCYHGYFPAQPLAQRPQDGCWQEPALFLQDSVPAGPLAIRVQSATHYVRRVVPLEQAKSAETRSYTLAPYSELQTLPQPDGRTRSLFAEDGLVAGSERFERFWLWPSGVPSPGAMREWGRHATAFVGQSHFDDADLLDQLFLSHAPRR